MRHKCIIKLQYGSYIGLEIIYCDENTDSDEIIARAWKNAKANFLPMAYTNAKIISRENYGG